MVKSEISSEQSEAVRSTTVANSWDIEGLRAARTREDGEEISCGDTKIPLYYIRADGYKVMLNSFGTCVNCQAAFHISRLNRAKDCENSSWPVEYEGSWCMTCWDLPETEWAENQKEEE